MNTRTTLVLAMLLAIVVCCYVLVTRRPEQPAIVEDTSSYKEPAAQDLLDDETQGEPVKIVVQRKGETEPWLFEREEEDGGTGGRWRMTAPVDVPATKYDVENIGRRLQQLTYTMSYKPGDPGAVTEAEAGLDAPQAVVTLTDADDHSETVEIGGEAPNSKTYVRVAGGEEIHVAGPSLKNVIKESALDYRERQAFDFDAAEVTRVEIDDRSRPDEPVTYAFVKDGAQWMMESPAVAKATNKVGELANSMCRLRAIKWHDDREDKLALYGLDAPARTIRVTVTTPPETPADEEENADEAQEDEEDEEPEAAPPEPTETVYVMHLSNRSPLGEESKVYFRVDDDPAVGTIMKSVADKFKPVPAEWREMSVTTADVKAATGIEIVIGNETTRLVRGNGTWTFEADGAPAEGAVIEELLDAIDTMEAVTFEDGVTSIPESYGLQTPRALIRLTIPGQEEIERIAVGGYSNDRLKRLVYVRRNEATSIAKVKSSQVAALLRGPSEYRDRTIFALRKDGIERIELSRDNRFAEGRIDLAFQRDGADWRMAAPIDAPVRTTPFGELLAALSTLRAERIVADADEQSAYGLHAPAAVVTIVHQPPTRYRLEPAPEAPDDTDAASPADEATGAQDDASPDSASDEQPDDQSTKLVSVPFEPPAERFELAVAEVDGTIYARRTDKDSIFVVARAFWDQLFDEYRTTEVLDFNDADVARFSIAEGDTVHTFVREDKQWRYELEPDLPLDAKKVDNLLLQLKDLRTERYATYGASLADFGLQAPAARVDVTMNDGTEHTLLVSARQCDADPSKGRYAVRAGRTDVFLLTPATIDRFAVSLDDLEAGD